MENLVDFEENIGESCWIWIKSMRIHLEFQEIHRQSCRITWKFIEIQSDHEKKILKESCRIPSKSGGISRLDLFSKTMPAILIMLVEQSQTTSSVKIIENKHDRLIGSILKSKSIKNWQ